MWRSGLIAVIFALLGLFCLSAAHADEVLHGSAARQRAAYRNQSYAGRIGLASGVSSLRPPEGKNYQYDGLRYTFYLGLTGDVNFNYFGFDLDTYYGSASVEQAGKKKGMDLYGGQLGAQARLPFFLGIMKLTPKAGFGYGVMSLTMDKETSGVVGLLTSNLAVGQQVSGVYYSLGLEFAPLPFLVLTGDYSQSLSAGGEIKVQAGANIPLNGKDASFERIRVGAYARILPTVLLGVQYVERKVKVNLPLNIVNTDAISPTQVHYLGSMIFEIP